MAGIDLRPSRAVVKAVVEKVDSKDVADLCIEPIDGFVMFEGLMKASQELVDRNPAMGLADAPDLVQVLEITRDIAGNRVPEHGDHFRCGPGSNDSIMDHQPKVISVTVAVRNSTLLINNSSRVREIICITPMRLDRCDARNMLQRFFDTTRSDFPHLVNEDDLAAVLTGTLEVPSVPMPVTPCPKSPPERTRTNRRDPQ